MQLNTGSITRGPAGNDLNVEPAWMQGITGSGVVVGIVDNGKQIGTDFEFGGGGGGGVQPVCLS